MEIAEQGVLRSRWSSRASPTDKSRSDGCMENGDAKHAETAHAFLLDI